MNNLKNTSIFSILFLASAVFAGILVPTTAEALEFKQDEFSLKFAGAAMLDGISYDGSFNNSNDGNTGSDLFFRRVRLAISGNLQKDWKYKIEYDLVPSSLTDVFIQYTGFGKKLALSAGRIKVPFGLDDLTSSKDTLGLERNVLTQLFAPGRIDGVMASGYGDQYTYSVGLFDDGQGNNNDLNLLFAARLTYTPLSFDGPIGIHLGAAYIRRSDAASSQTFIETADDSGIYTINGGTTVNGRPGFRIPSSANRIRSGVFAHDGEERRSLEFLMLAGRLTVLGEWMDIEYDGVNDPAGRNWGADFDAYSVQASWMLAGSTRPYKAKKGVMGAPKPTGELGSIEVYVSYSDVDVTTGNGLNEAQDRYITAGADAETTAFGINWFMSKHIRFSAYYVQYDNDDPGFDEDSGDGIGVRLQYKF